MNQAHDILQRRRSADAAANASAYRHIQPVSTTAIVVRWATAIKNWVNRPDNGSYVDCHPCADAAGAGVDDASVLRIYLPRTAGSDPNVVYGQVVSCLPADGGVHVAVSGYLDAAVGTIKMWSSDDLDPPVGWTECTEAGTSGRQAPSVRGLAGTFPVGKLVGDADFGAVGQTGNRDRKEHCHRLTVDLGAEPCTPAEINTGTWDTVSVGAAVVNHLPPWCVVRFIERYDNSSLS